MLQTLLNQYEDAMSLKVFDVDHEFINYLTELQKNGHKVGYLTKRLLEPQLTDKDIAEQIGVTPKTICEWKKEELFIRTLAELRERRYRYQRSEIVNTLYEKAVAGDQKAVELFLRHTSN